MSQLDTTSVFEATDANPLPIILPYQQAANEEAIAKVEAAIKSIVDDILLGEEPSLPLQPQSTQDVQWPNADPAISPSSKARRVRFPGGTPEEARRFSK